MDSVTSLSISSMPIPLEGSWARQILPYLSITALSSTFCLFLSGLSICSRIRQRRTTEGTGSAPFLISFVSCWFWLQYGFVKDDSVVILCNAVGCLLQTSYLAYYYVMTRNKKWLNRVIGFELVCLALMEYFVQYGELPDRGAEALGIACIALNIANIGAPLLSVGEVIRTKSSESLPLPLCVMCLLVSLQWLLYGILVEDFVIQFPNTVASVLSTIQLSLFVIYPAQKAPTNKYLRLSDDNDNLI